MIVLVFVVQVLQLSFTIASDYRNAIDRAGHTNQRMAEFVEEGIDRTIDACDLVLQRTVEALRGRDLARAAGDAGLRAMLNAMTAPLPYIASVTIIDERGQFVLSTVSDGHPTTSVTDRAYFIAHAQGLKDMFIGPLILGRYSGKRHFTLTRPILDEAGAFRGVALVGIDGAKFTDFVNPVERETNGRIAIYKTDGVLLMREPLVDSAMGKSFHSHPLFTTHLPRAPTGTFETDSPIDGERRIASYQLSNRWPIVVLTSTGKADALVTWRANLINSVLLVAVEAVVLLLLLVVTLRSMTAENQAHQQTEAALGEKVLLLQEIHHRVKNNLQMVVSMLGLQGLRSGREVAAILDESITRINAMAMVHEVIYTSGEFGSVDAGAYIDRLCRVLVRQAPQVDLAVETQPLDISTDDAMFLAILVNEVVCNALKHAFPGGQGGRIRVSLRRTAEGGAELEIADNGIGLPADFNPERSTGLGGSLMTTVARQLKATIRFANAGGTVVTLTLDASRAGQGAE